MDDFEKIQKLIRLKRHELPPTNFMHDFVARLHQRERSELLKQSAPAMLWEQIKVWFDQLFAPKWTLAAAVVLMVVVPTAMLMPGNSRDKEYKGSARSVTIAIDESGRTIPAFSIDAVRIMGVEPEPDPGFLSKHFQGGYDQFVIVSDGESEDTIAVPHDLPPNRPAATK